VGRIASTAAHPVNSGKRPQIVVLINLSHSLPTVRQRAIVKGVWMYSDRGKATVTGVVGTVGTLPCHGMEVIALVTSRVWASYGESLVDRVDRDPASGPIRGRARRNLRPRP